jgi:hypothetical protein
MKRRTTWRVAVAPLPLQALYRVSELAAAASLSRARLLRVLRVAGVCTLRSGQLILVPLSELRAKAWPFWESIQTAEAMRDERRRVK